MEPSGETLVEIRFCGTTDFKYDFLIVNLGVIETAPDTRGHLNKSLHVFAITPLPEDCDLDCGWVFWVVEGHVSRFPLCS